MARFFHRHLASSSLAAALLTAIAAPAIAQTAPPPPEATAKQPLADSPKKGPHQPHGLSPEQREEQMARRSAELKQKLQITPAQESAWTAFTTSMKPDAGQRHARLEPVDMDKLTTPERIDRMRAMRAQFSVEMDRRDDAVKTFYAALTPAQQKTFDAEGARMHHRMGGPGPGPEPRGARAPQGAPAPDAPPPPAPDAPAPQQ